MSNPSRNAIDPAIRLPELPQEGTAPAENEPTTSSKRGGLLIGLGMIVLLTLLVYLNMG